MGKDRMGNTEQCIFRKVSQDHSVNVLTYKLSNLNFLVVIGKSLKIFVQGK